MTTPSEASGSPRSPRVGFFMFPGDGPPPMGWNDLVAIAQHAEEVGFDSLWLPDHVQIPMGDDTLVGMWECWTFLAGLATVTSRVDIGTLVASTSYRNPALIAKMAEAIDEMSNGRVILGIGAGHIPTEAHAFDFPYDYRASRFEEAIQIITSLVRERTVDFEGRWHSARGAVMRPDGPRSHGLPVMVGAEGPRMIRIAARYADELNIDIGTTLDSIGPLSERIDDACRDVGRDPATLRRSAFIPIDLSSPERPPDPYLGSMFDEVAYRGTPEELANVFRAYAAAGFHEVQVWPNPCTIDFIDAFAPVLALLD